MSSGKVLLGLIAGATAGALLGILFAPEKGSIIRSKISNKSNDYSDALKEKFNEFVDNVSDKYEGAKGDITDFVKKGKDKNENAESLKETKKA